MTIDSDDAPTGASLVCGRRVRIRQPFNLGHTNNDSGGTMQLREAFARSQQGDPEAQAAMEEFATSSTGSKDAEAILLEETNKALVTNPEAGFEKTFMRVAAAHPLLHRAHLNRFGGR